MKELFAKLSTKELLNACNSATLSHKQLFKLQNTLIIMLDEFAEACKSNNIKPILIGGSLLGQIRHNGFIPWDDDLDIGLMREDYERLIKIFDKELSDRYEISAPKKKYPTHYRFIQLFRNDTVLVGEDYNKARPNKICLDIFPIDYVPDSVIKRKVKGYLAESLMAIASFVDSYKNMPATVKNKMLKTSSGKILYYMRMVTGFIFSWRSPKKWYESVDSVIQYKKKTSLVTIAPGRKHYFGEIVPTKTFLPLKPVVFEGVNVFVPNDPNTYLTNLYGDFMKIPPEDKRESHSVIELKTL